MRKISTLGIPLLVGTLALAGCGSNPGGADGDPVAVVTTTPLGSVVDDITRCADSSAVTLMGPGDDPHEFSPSSRQITEMARAKLVIVNGLGLEANLGGAIDSARTEGATVYEVAPNVDPIPFGGHDEDGHAEDEHAGDEHAGEGPEDHAEQTPGEHPGETPDEHTGQPPGDHAEETPGEHADRTPSDHPEETPGEHADRTPSDHPEETPGEHTEDGHDEEEHGSHDGHNHEGEDPHFWLDADRMSTAAELIGAKLTEVTDDPNFVECGQQVASDLTALDEEIRNTMASIPADKRLIITDHDAFGYFARAYDFEIAGVVVPGGSTDAEASSQHLAELVRVIEEHDVSTIFSNSAVSPKLVESLAAETGRDIKVVPLYVGSVGPDGSGAETYVDMMRANAQLLTESLK